MAPIAARRAVALPDISRATSKPSTMPSSRGHVAQVALARVDRHGGAHPLRDRAADRVRLRNDDEARPGVAHDRGGHQADGPGTRDQDVLAQDREGERGVDRVAERVEDRGDLLVDARPSGARCWSSGGAT